MTPSQHGLDHREIEKAIEIIADEIRSCTRCNLHQGRQNAVPGEGDPGARVMLVGEAPGREEDVLGKPFVGRSGRLLTELLDRAGLERPSLFITSVVKCRPHGNRTPRRKEWSTCVPAHLQRQIDVIQPDVICVLGGLAGKALLGFDRVTQIRGKVFRQDGRSLIPTYHPAAALRSRTWHRALLEDLKKLREML